MPVTVPLGIIFRANMQPTRMFAWITQEMYVSSATLLFGHLGSTSTTSCAAITCLTVASALHQLRRAPRLLVSRSHRLYINYIVRRDYSSPGRTGSTSTTLCDATARLPVARSLPQPCHASSRHSTSRWSVALSLTVRPVTASSGATTCRPDCTGSTAPMSCIRTRRLVAQLVVSRLHWPSPCARSFRCAS
jgi:hypothetical protein